MTAGPDWVKVRFSLDVDGESWPPVASEGVWATPLGEDRYRIDNTPWFVRDIAYGDVVEALPDADGVVWATRRLEWMGHLTIRVAPLSGEPRSVLDAFARFGVTGENAEPAWSIVALDVPPGAPLLDIKNLLRDGLSDGRWDYEEGCVSDEWRAL